MTYSGLCACPRTKSLGYQPNTDDKKNCLAPYACKEMSKQIKEALNDK